MLVIFTNNPACKWIESSTMTYLDKTAFSTF